MLPNPRLFHEDGTILEGVRPLQPPPELRTNQHPFQWRDRPQGASPPLSDLERERMWELRHMGYPEIADRYERLRKKHFPVSEARWPKWKGDAIEKAKTQQRAAFQRGSGVQSL